MDLKEVSKIRDEALIALNKLTQILGTVEKSVSESEKKQAEAEAEQKRLADSIIKDSQEHSAWKTDSLKSVKEDRDKALSDKNEAAAILKDAKEKSLQAERLLQLAENKELYWTQRNSDIEKLKSDLEEKANKAKEFLRTL